MLPLPYAKSKDIIVTRLSLWDMHLQHCARLEEIDDRYGDFILDKFRWVIGGNKKFYTGKLSGIEVTCRILGM